GVEGNAAALFAKPRRTGSGPLCPVRGIPAQGRPDRQGAARLGSGGGCGGRAMTSYGHAFAAWRAACQPDWDAYTRHSFVEGLRDGTLPQSAFLTYLVQDYLFLQNFSRAWALAVVKAGDLTEMQTCST